MRGFRQRYNLFTIEIGRGTRTLQRSHLIGLSRMKRIRIVLGKNCDRSQTHLGGRAHNANRDFTAVGDQNTLRNHWRCV